MRPLLLSSDEYAARSALQRKVACPLFFLPVVRSARSLLYLSAVLRAFARFDIGKRALSSENSQVEG